VRLSIYSLCSKKNLFNQLIEYLNLLIDNSLEMGSRASNRNKSKQKKPSRGTNAKSKRAPKTDESSGVRQALMAAGKKLFAQKGLSGTSIRDIAQLAQVNSSMISYYFSGKEGLYKECLREIGESRLNFVKSIFVEINNKEELKLRLKLFMENLVALYLEDRDAGLIIVREYDRIHSPAEKVFKETFIKIFELLVDCFRLAQKKSIIPSNKDPFILASLFFGCISSQMRLDHIKDKVYNRSLRQPDEQSKVIEHLVGFLFAA